MKSQLLLIPMLILILLAIFVVAGCSHAPKSRDETSQTPSSTETSETTEPETEGGQINQCKSQNACASGFSCVKRVVGGFKEISPSETGQCVSDEVVKEFY